MRFTAPDNTAGISLSIGYFAVAKGAIEVPDDTPAGDIAGLQANGFVRADAAPAPAPLDLKPFATPSSD